MASRKTPGVLSEAQTLALVSAVHGTKPAAVKTCPGCKRRIITGDRCLGCEQLDQERERQEYKETARSLSRSEILDILRASDRLFLQSAAGS